MKSIVVGPDCTVHCEIVNRNDLPSDGIVQGECVFGDAVCVLSWDMADGDVSLPCAFFVDVVCSSAESMLETQSISKNSNSSAHPVPIKQ